MSLLTKIVSVSNYLKETSLSLICYEYMKTLHVITSMGQVEEQRERDLLYCISTHRLCLPVFVSLTNTSLIYIFIVNF